MDRRGFLTTMLAAGAAPIGDNMTFNFTGKPLYLKHYPSFGDFDKEALRRLVRKIGNPNKRILEVGSWLGAGSTTVLINEAKSTDSMIVCVDTWRGSPNVQKHLDISRKYDLFGTFMHYVKKAGGENLVHAMVMPSLKAAELVADATFDMVFIDGDHSYSSTAPDIAAWRKKVKPGGILCGHDCENRLSASNRQYYFANRDADTVPAMHPPFQVNHPGVIIAVGEAFGDRAHLWAEEEIQLPDRRRGRATIWDVTI
jgi:predicted O-methyltransferase YrrM